MTDGSRPHQTVERNKRDLADTVSETERWIKETLRLREVAAFIVQHNIHSSLFTHIEGDAAA